MDQAAWGGYMRRNTRIEGFSIDRLLDEQSLFEYDAIMMYSPPLPRTDAAQSHGWKEGLRCSMGR